jgi:hypothetical protein
VPRLPWEGRPAPHSLLIPIRGRILCRVAFGLAAPAPGAWLGRTQRVSTPIPRVEEMSRCKPEVVPDDFKNDDPGVQRIVDFLKLGEKTMLYWHLTRRLPPALQE